MLLQLRVGGQAARNGDETLPLECGCVGQETTGAGGLAKALRTVPVVLDIAERVRDRADRTPGSSTSPTRSASSPGRCSTPGTGRSACATWPSASSGGSPACSASTPERVDPRPRRAQPPDLGARRVLVDGVDVLPELLDAHRAELAERRPGCRWTCCAGWASVPSYYLRYFYAHDAVVAEQRAAPSRAAEVAAIERAAAGAVRRPGAGREAGAARAARRRVLLRGRGRPGRLAARRPRRRAGGQRPQRRHPAVPARRRRDRGAGPGRRARGRRRCRSSRSTRCSPAWSRTSSAYEELALDAALHGGRDRVLPGAARAPAGRPARRRDPADRPAARRQPRAPARGLRMTAAVLAVDGGNSKTDVALIGDRRHAARAQPRPGLLPPEHRGRGDHAGAGRARRGRGGRGRAGPGRSGGQARRVLPGRRRPAGRGRDAARSG